MTITSKAKNLAGITLIEVLLYLAIFGLVFMTIIQFFFFLEDSNRLAAETIKIDRNVIFLSQHFEDSFKNNSRVIVNPPHTGSSTATYFDNELVTTDDADGIIVLDPSTDIIDEFNNTTTNDVIYRIDSVDNDRITFEKDSTIVEITRDDLKVNKFLLESILDKDDNIIGVRITINIVSMSEQSASREFTSSYFFE